MAMQNKVNNRVDFYSVEIEVLVKCAMQGDRRALSDLCESISRTVLFMVTCMLGEDDGIEDVAQEALLEVCRSIHTLREPKAFKKWLSTIVVNKKNKYLSEKQKRGVVLDINDCIAELTEEKDEFIPDASLENAELRRVIKELILELPERQREAVVLRYYNDLNQREIAKAMDVNFQCVSQYLALAKKKIKSGVERYMHSDGFDSGKKYSTVSLGALIAVTLEQEAGLLGLVSGTVSESVVATALEASVAEVAAAEVVTTAATTVATETTLASSLALAVKTHATSIWLYASVCALVVAAVVVGYSLSGQPAASEISQALHIVLVGGTSAGEGYIVTNPQDALIAADEITILYWWITDVSSSEIVQEGIGYTIAEGFEALNQSGERGRHMLFIRSQSEGYTPHTSYISFFNNP